MRPRSEDFTGPHEGIECDSCDPPSADLCYAPILVGQPPVQTAPRGHVIPDVVNNRTDLCLETFPC
jgi:hypothetical protein